MIIFDLRYSVPGGCLCNMFEYLSKDTIVGLMTFLTFSLLFYYLSVSHGLFVDLSLFFCYLYFFAVQ